MTGLNKLLLNKHFWSFVLLTILVVCLFLNYLKPNLRNLNRSANYYNSSNVNSNVVISDRLKDPNTLEQEMVNKMITNTKMDHPKLTPRYHPLLPNSAGATLVE